MLIITITKGLIKINLYPSLIITDVSGQLFVV